MIYKGRIAIVGEDDDPLPVNCEVSDHRLVIEARDGSVIGDWDLRQLSALPTTEGVVLRTEGERLLVAVGDSDSFARALGVTNSPRVADRISDARGASDQERMRPLLAVLVAASVVVALGIVLWATGSTPFGREPGGQLTATADSSAATVSPSTTTQVIVAPLPSSTTTLSPYQKSQKFLLVYGEFLDGLNPLMEEMNESQSAGDYAAEGAACKLGETWVDDWTPILTLLDYPSYELRATVEALLDELGLAFFWCSGGDRYSSDASGRHWGVAAELFDRIAADF